jgi:hypothetical protein
MLIRRLLPALLGAILMLDAGQAALAAQKFAPSSPSVRRERDGRAHDRNRGKLAERRHEQEARALPQFEKQWTEWLRLQQGRGC